MGVPLKQYTSTDLYLFFFLLTGLLLSFSGNANFVDENLIIQNVESIVERGELTVHDMFQALEGPNGKSYSRYGIGYPILMIPFYLVGELLPSWPMFMGNANVFAMLLSSLLITALVGWVFYRICIQFQTSPRLAVALSVILIFATPFWPYSQTLFRLTVSSLVLLLIFWCALLYQKVPKKIYFIQIALLVAFAANLREDLAFAVILMGGYAVYIVSPKEKMKMLASFAAGGLLGIAIWCGHNYIRFELIFIENYKDISFDYPLIISLPELLAGKRAGLFLYAPCTLLFPLSFLMMKRYRKLHVWLLCFFILVSYLILYGKSNDWYGGSCYGPRYMYFLIPFALFPSIWFFKDPNVWKKFFLVFTALVGIIMNWPGIYAHQGRYPSFFRSPSFFEVLWRPLGHPVYSLETDISLWWIRMIKLNPNSFWPYALIVVICAFLYFGYRLWRSVEELESTLDHKIEGNVT